MNPTISSILKVVAEIIELFSVAVLIYGTIGCAKSFVVSRFKIKTNKDNFTQTTVVKNNLASYILLSLEILIVADIISSIISPDAKDIAILAAIVVIRTVISYFLAKEIEDFREFEESDN